ncbi:MAG: M15 family metallopeptidase [Spirochaetota bacterium]|nr:M15 family metallopeptidase [Spirochaetota bacterium]
MDNKIHNNLPIGEELVDKWHSLPLDYQPDDLEDIPLKYRAENCKDKDLRLRKEALFYLMEMIDDAGKDNIYIKCVSAFRTASYQEMIYKRALEKEGENQMSSAKPGHSEHQLGTVVDVSSSEIEFGLKESFCETKEYTWILNNAFLYGYYISYTKENHLQKGYIWEPWHLRYMGKKYKRD